MDDQDGLPPAQRQRAMLTVAIAVSVSVLGTALPNVALPSIAQDLHVTPSASVWVINAYQIIVMVTVLPFSSLGDIYGYRRVYGFGLATFTLGSLLCALAPDLTTLIAARTLQGFGGAGLVSVNTALVRYIYPRASLGRGLGYNALIVATSSAIGPTIASAILALGDWPWLFAVNVPFGILAVALVPALPATPRASHRFDLASALLNAATFGLFFVGFDGVGEGAGGDTAAVALVVALAIGVVFVRRQARLRAPMLPIDLFRKPVFSLSVATAVCCFVGQTAAYVALPFLFQSEGASDVEIGLLMTPWPLAVAIVAPQAGRWSDRMSAGLLGGWGLAMMTVGLVTIAFLGAHPAFWDVAWRMALTGAGFALFQAPNNRLLLSSVPRERSGAGSGMLSTSRLFGQSVGAATVALVFAFTEAGNVGRGAAISLLIGAAATAIAAVLSSLRLLR